MLIPVLPSTQWMGSKKRSIPKSWYPGRWASWVKITGAPARRARRARWAMTGTSAIPPAAGSGPSGTRKSFCMSITSRAVASGLRMNGSCGSMRAIIARIRLSPQRAR